MLCYETKFFPHLVPPMFWIPSQLEGAYIGKDVTLECHSEAYPKSINYWVKENGSMLISSKKESETKIYFLFAPKNIQPLLSAPL